VSNVVLSHVNAVRRGSQFLATRLTTLWHLISGEARSNLERFSISVCYDGEVLIGDNVPLTISRIEQVCLP
jgi:hypothetical protein